MKFHAEELIQKYLRDGLHGVFVNPTLLLRFIAFCSECIGLLGRKPAPELPLLAVDMVRYGLQHYDLSKM